MGLHIIFCTDGIFPHAVGGMQKHSKLLIEQLAKSGDHQLTVVHPHSVPVFDKKLGIKEFPVKGINEKKNYLLETFKYSKRVSAILDNYPDAVIYSQGLSVWYRCEKYKSRLIVNPHGLEPYQGLSLKDNLLGIPFRMVFNHIFRNSRYVVSLGGKLTPILEAAAKDKSKVKVIPNAVILSDDFDLSSKKTNTPIQALFVARFAHNKGIHILLKAIRRLNESGYSEKVFFKLAGKGPLFNKYSSEYRYKNVNYLGFVSDEELETLYKESDVFVFPTLFEGMPTVVLEAMEKGLPIIVSDTGATAELVNKENGFLIRKDSVDSLVEALQLFLLLDFQEKVSLKEASRKKVEVNFTWEKVALKHTELFEQI